MMQQKGVGTGSLKLSGGSSITDIGIDNNDTCTSVQAQHLSFSSPTQPSGEYQ